MDTLSETCFYKYLLDFFCVSKEPDWRWRKTLKTMMIKIWVTVQQWTRNFILISYSVLKRLNIFFFKIKFFLFEMQILHRVMDRQAGWFSICCDWKTIHNGQSWAEPYIACHTAPWCCPRRQDLFFNHRSFVNIFRLPDIGACDGRDILKSI